MGIMATDTPDYVPAEIRNEEPLTCKGCDKRIWYKRESHLICHETPPCREFVNTMRAMGGINLFAPEGEG